VCHRMPTVLVDHGMRCTSDTPPTTGSVRVTYDRILTPGDIQMAETHLQEFGFDPGPVDSVFTA
jgi:hypothetical protein